MRISFFNFFFFLSLLSSFDDDDYYDVKLSEKKEEKINLELQLSLIIDLLWLLFKTRSRDWLEILKKVNNNNRDEYKYMNNYYNYRVEIEK